MTRSTSHGMRVVMIGVLVAAASLIGFTWSGWADSSDEPPTAVDVETQIDAMTSAGLPADDPKVKLLRQVRSEILAADPGASDPDPDGHSLESPADQGEIECEPLPPFTSSQDLTRARCVSVPRGADASLFVFLTPRAEALVVDINPKQTSAHTHAIPPLPSLGDSKISVTDEGNIEVSTIGVTISIPTVDW